ncbi:MAG: hypothetical protein PHU47_03445, partial [Candidatus ainarchaeum sp.]|nr:hypothetical protein [Candidatus ainarchaeum sp.]
NITIQYKGKINLATIDDLQYKVSAYAPGIKSRVESSFQTYLWISPPACIKVTQESLNYSLEINKPRERSITLTNNCAEPIMVYGIDRSGNLYTDAFGSTNVEFYPSNAQQILPVGSSGSYVLKMTASQYEFPRLQKPIRFVGRTQSGAAVSSETTLITTEVVVQDEEVIRDYEQTYSASIPVCQQVTGESSRTLQLNFPIVSTTCDGQAGYCDALTGAHFILKKVQELQTRVVNDSAQIRNQTQNSGCSSQSYNAGYCQISDILQDSREVEFYLYLQNDAITIDLLRDLLTKDQRGTPKYNKINSYLVLEKSGAMSPAGISVAGGRLLVDSKLRGCGKYKITIDGYVAANHELILPEKSALYISVEEMEKPESCSKFAENFIIYLPKDRELRQDSHYNTWLTMITGKKEFGEKVATDVFNDARRYAENLERSNRFNTINLFLGNITEKQDAVAKISFRTTGANQKTPEIIDILINNEYGSFNEEENTQVFDERVINNISKVVKGILDQDMADVCISENKEYLLLLSFRDPISGTLELKSKDNVNAIKLQPNQNCKTLEIKSSINETVLINHEEITGLFVTYNYQGREQTSLPISLTPGQAVDFNVCVTPSMTNTTTIIGSKFKVTATSKFRDSGAAGFRAQSLELDLTSFGITPLELFEIINSSVQKNSVANNELDTIEFYSFVDWDDTYSPNNTETQCDVIKKYLEKYPDTQKFFVTKEWCPELDVSDVAKKVNREKAGSNTWKFFENCFGRCALCSGIGDLALGIISGGVTLPMALKNIALDCGVFTCGIPSGIYYASQVTGDNWGILNGLKKAFSALGSAFSFVGDLISGAIDGVANLFGMGTAGAQELTVDQVESFSEDGQDESFLETMDQLRGGAGVGVGLATLHQAGYTPILRSTSSPVMAAGSSRIITNFNLPPSGVASIPTSQMTIQGTPITSIYKPLPNPGYSLSEAALRRQLMGDIKRGGADWIFSLKGSDKGLQNVFHPDPSDAAELTRIMSPVNTVDDFMKLPHDDMYSVARILKHPNAQFRNPNTGGLGHPHTNKVVDRILHL